MNTLNVVSQDGKKIDDLKIDQKLFDGSVNKPLLHDAVLMYQANTRIGSANTKDRSEVRGGGKKPWRQKGTGRARVGSIRNPLWRGGGVVFGPKPRDFHYRIPKKALKRALCSALNDKLNDEKITVIDKIELTTFRTKDFLGVLKKLKINTGKEKVLFVTDENNDNLRKASNNLKKIKISAGTDINAYNVILADKVVFEKLAFAKVEKRLAL